MSAPVTSPALSRAQTRGPRDLRGPILLGMVGLDLVQDAFQPEGATRDEILAAAARNSVPPRVIELLRAIPDRRFRSMRELWVHHPDYDVDIDIDAE